MVILVDYINSKEKADARKIIDKLCESYKCEFFDLEEKISYGDTSVPSLEFTMLKNALDTDIPAIRTDVVIDNSILQGIMDNFDDFQIGFIGKMLQSLGTVLISLYKKDDTFLKIDNDKAFSFCIDSEFFVDLKKKLDVRIAKVKSSPFYMLLSEIGAYGFYLGPCDMDNLPTKVIVVPGGAGQKISYDEYANWTLSTMPLKTIEHDGLKTLEAKDECFAFVRQHHPAELIVKKLVVKTLKVKH